MSKSPETLKLEQMLERTLWKQNVYGCPEVTIGWFGKERVDYMTIDQYSIVRCYEIKVSKADFNSRSAHTFVGHLNYYVMPPELIEELRDKIPGNIGIHNGSCVVRRPKKQEPTVDVDDLKMFFIRSLRNQYDRAFKKGDQGKIKQLEAEVKHFQSLGKKYYQLEYDYLELNEELRILKRNKVVQNGH